MSEPLRLDSGVRVRHLCRLIDCTAEPGVGSDGFDISTRYAALSCAQADDGRFEVFCDEYTWPANFCPYCGAKAPVQVDAQRVYTDRQRAGEGSQ